MQLYAMRKLEKVNTLACAEHTAVIHSHIRVPSSHCQLVHMGLQHSTICLPDMIGEMGVCMQKG